MRKLLSVFCACMMALSCIATTLTAFAEGVDTSYHVTEVRTNIAGKIDGVNVRFACTNVTKEALEGKDFVRADYTVERNGRYMNGYVVITKAYNSIVLDDITVKSEDFEGGREGDYVIGIIFNNVEPTDSITVTFDTSNIALNGRAFDCGVEVYQGDGGYFTSDKINDSDFASGYQPGSYSSGDYVGVTFDNAEVASMKIYWETAAYVSPFEKNGYEVWLRTDGEWVQKTTADLSSSREVYSEDVICDTLALHAHEQIEGVKIVFLDGEITDHKFAPKMYELQIYGRYTGSADDGDGSGEEIPVSRLILGEMLALTATDAEAIVDNSGMSGIEAANHLHGTSLSDMYVFDNGETVILQHNETEALGQLYIWNYSESGRTDCGVKELNIKYSVDGEVWTDFGTVTLPQASQGELDTYGGCVASNFDEPINLGGVPGRYISLTPLSNYGGDLTGLAEVRLFRHKTRPEVGTLVMGEVLASANGHTATSGINITAAANNQGMSDLISNTATHNNNSLDMWYTSSEDNAMYVMNLDGTYPLKEIVLWNYNDPLNLENGIKTFEIYYTVERPCDINITTDGNGKATDQTVSFTGGDWKKLSVGGSSVFTLPQGDGSEALAPSLTLKLDEIIHAQHLKIVPKSNYGGTGYGMSELRLVAGKGWAVEPSRNWTGLLSSSGTFDYQGEAYNRNGGWIGADGIHMYNMNGAQQQGSLTDESKTFVIFQDTAVGSFNNYKGWDSQNGYDASHSGWVNMSYLLINGKEPDVRNIQFILQGKNSENHPYSNICNRHYWIGDMTMIGGKLYALATRYMGWDTAEGPEGYDLIDIPLGNDLYPDMNQVPTQVVDSEAYSDHSDDVPEYARGCIFENTVEAGAPDPDGYIYVFSTKDSKFRIARCLPSDYAGNYGNWQFWGGSENGWLDDAETAFSATESQSSTYNIGNESNVVYSSEGVFANKYINLYTDGSIFGQIRVGTADSLTSGFANPISVLWSTEKYEYVMDRGYDASSQWNYNAKAQVTVSAQGELLFTYHIGVNDTVSNTSGLEYVHPVFYNMFVIE